MNENRRELILDAARRAAQAHGYRGLNFRDLAEHVGIKAASVHYHFPGKADLGAAVARRYREDAAAALQALTDETGDPVEALRRYPVLFRAALENDNRMCLASFMATEYDDLPDAVKVEVQAFTDVHVAWLAGRLSAAGLIEGGGQARARAIYAAIIGAQLMARSRCDAGIYDSLIESFRGAGLLPG